MTFTTNTKSIQAAMIIRCINAALSASASSILLFFILVDFAASGLKSPYSRIIFGLSIADVLQSLGLLISPFAAPTDPNHIFGRGNTQSCDAIGFFTVMGSLAVPLYTLHLTYYFLKRVKYKVKPSDFANGEEKWLHILTWVFSITVSEYAVVKGQINPTRNGASCYIASSPLGCSKSDEQECIRGEGARITNALAVVVLVFIVFVTLFCVLGAFSLHVYRSEKQLQPTKAKAKDVIVQKKSDAEEVFREDDKVNEEPLDDKVNEKQLSPDLKNEALLRYANQAMDLVLTKSAVVQSSLYIFAFMFVYIGPIISRIKGKSLNFDEVMFWWTSIFYPLGGLFNMIIYTRPKVKALQRVVPELSNFRSFIAVIVSGGETPNVIDILDSAFENNDNTPSRTRNSRLDRLRRVLGYEERDNLYEDMENAMKEDYNVDIYIQGLYENDGISLDDDDDQDYNIVGARQI